MSITFSVDASGNLVIGGLPPEYVPAVQAVVSDVVPVLGHKVTGQVLSGILSDLGTTLPNTEAAAVSDLLSMVTGDIGQKLPFGTIMLQLGRAAADYMAFRG